MSNELIERMRTQLHVWEDEEPHSDWWTYQREYGEAFHRIQKLQKALESILTLRPAGDINTANNTRVLVMKMERIASETLVAQASA